MTNISDEHYQSILAGIFLLITNGMIILGICNKNVSQHFPGFIKNKHTKHDTGE